ncbi:MAG TPA: thioredoxin family protein [Chthoniobacteraceae bacterium]|nr:thioredoxin family protein [Chthoniobacteraceae bacterium]
MKTTLLSFLPIAFSAIAVAVAPMSAHAAAPEIGKPAPDFSLPGADGKTHSLSEHKGSVVVLEWTNPECPFVKKFYNAGAMQKFQKAAVKKGIVWYRINSNAPGKQGSQTPENLAAYDKAHKVAATTSLSDADSKVARLYDAKTTPHMYIINKEGVLVYNGAIDDKPTPDAGAIKEAKNYVRAALKEVMTGKPVTTATTKPYGCGVKYAD